MTVKPSDQSGDTGKARSKSSVRECDHCRKHLEPHPLSDNLCLNCYFNLTERRYAKYIRHLVAGDIYSEQLGNLSEESRAEVRAMVRANVLKAINETTKQEVTLLTDYAQNFEAGRPVGLTRLEVLEQSVSGSIELLRADRGALNKVPNDSAAKFVFEMTLAIGERRLWRRYRLRRYRFDADRQESLLRHKQSLEGMTGIALNMRTENSLSKFTVHSWDHGRLNLGGQR